MQYTQPHTLRMRDLAAREQAVYSKIPGMKELLRTPPEKMNDAELRYPPSSTSHILSYRRLR